MMSSPLMLTSLRPQLGQELPLHSIAPAFSTPTSPPPFPASSTAARFALPFVFLTHAHAHTNFSPTLLIYFDIFAWRTWTFVLRCTWRFDRTKRRTWTWRYDHTQWTWRILWSTPSDHCPTTTTESPTRTRRRRLTAIQHVLELLIRSAAAHHLSGPRY
jgi:hypothetical protein